MSKLRRFLLLNALVLGGSHSVALAQDCGRALVQDISLRSISDNDRIRILLDTNHDTASAISKGGSFRATVPIYNVPYTFGGDYRDDENSQDRLSQKYRIVRERDTQGQYASARLSEINFAAYRECLIHNAAGLNIALEEGAGKDVIKVMVVFNTASDDQTQRLIKIEAGQNAEPITGVDTYQTNGGLFKNEAAFRRTGSGSVVIYAYETRNDGQAISQKKVLAVPPLPRLFERVNRTELRVSGPESEQDDSHYFNARYSPSGDSKEACISRTTSDGILTNLHAYVFHQTITAAGGAQFFVGKPENRGNEICAEVGCTGVLGVSNCAGWAHARGSELVRVRWEELD